MLEDDKKLPDRPLFINNLWFSKNFIHSVTNLIRNPKGEAHSLIVERLPESREVDELRDRVRTLERVVSKF